MKLCSPQHRPLTGLYCTELSVLHCTTSRSLVTETHCRGLIGLGGQFFGGLIVGGGFLLKEAFALGGSSTGALKFSSFYPSAFCGGF